MRKVYIHIIKSFIDFFVASLALLMLLPLFLILIFLLLITGHKKVFFIQKRIGYQEKVFKLIKFKSMTDKKDAEGNLMQDALRLTRFGKFLRASSLDELPQLINVIKGDMSIVGPRPLLPEYLPLYSAEQKQRHDVKPGITGWAQINGRNAISWAAKFKLDIWYVNHMSFTTDLRIIIITFLKLFKPQQINQQGKATTDPFNGDN